MSSRNISRARSGSSAKKETSSLARESNRPVASCAVARNSFGNTWSHRERRSVTTAQHKSSFEVKWYRIEGLDPHVVGNRLQRCRVGTARSHVL